MRTVKAGATDVSVIVRILDSTTFLPETGVVAATGGLTVTYRRETAAAVALTAVSTPALSDLALLTTAHTDGGLLHIADGYLRFDCPDAAFAAGVDGVTITVAATDMVGIGCYVQLVGYDARTELTAVALAHLDADVSSRAATGDAMTLADDAITAAKIAADAIGSSELAATATAEIADAVWDEATADHVAAGSFGAWVAAVTASLAAIVAAIAALPAAVWAYVTRTLTSTAASTVSAVSGSSLTITAGATYSATLSGLTIPADWLVMWLTIKDDEAKTDAQAIVQIVESNPGVGTDGMKFLNGAAGTAAHGALTVDQPGGSVAIAIKAVATVQLDAAVLGYDLKVLSGTDTVTLLTSGVVSVQRTETKSIT